MKREDPLNDLPTSPLRAAPGLQVQDLAWLLPASVLFLLALVPTTLHAQLLLSAALLAALVPCHYFGRQAHTLRAQSLWRLTVIAVCTLLSLRYMHWRATESMPLQFGMAAMVGGLLLFLAEAYGFVNMVLGFMINSAPFHRRSVPLPADERALPTVDVFIPTYNEDAAVLRPTVIAATQLNYPAHKLRVYVLDDGGTAQKLADADPLRADAARRRAESLKALAERYGATYLTRERNLHAKAGNLNAALAHARGELLLILDCDHIPTADFLQRTVGFFLADPKLFVLQTPHNFVSPDPLERNLDTHHESPAENELFYDVMQPGLDFWGTSFFCGSAAVLRRCVIDELGGISGRTITEDAETTLDALSLGYKAAYYNRPMVSGLQPETFAGFIVQRVRWGQGMWQIFMLKNPWKQPKLRLVQRILYTNFAFYWGFAGARLIMLLAPPAYLLLGINLCDTTADQLLAYAGPALLGSIASTQFIYGRVRWPFVSQLYEIVQSVHVVRGLWEVMRRPTAPSFKVTPKGETLDADFVSSLARPFYVLLALTMAAVLAGLYRWQHEPWNQGAIAFVLFWGALDLLLLLGVLGITFERRQLRNEPRAPHEEGVVLHSGRRTWTGATVDASSTGLGVQLSPRPEGFGGLAPGLRVEVELPGRQRRLHATVLGVRPRRDGSVGVGLRYAFDNVLQERLAVDLAFGSSEVLVANNRRRHAGRSVLRSLAALFRHALTDGLDHLLHLRELWVQRQRARAAQRRDKRRTMDEHSHEA